MLLDDGVTDRSKREAVPDRDALCVPSAAGS